MSVYSSSCGLHSDAIGSARGYNPGFSDEVLPDLHHCGRYEVPVLGNFVTLYDVQRERQAEESFNERILSDAETGCYMHRFDIDGQRTD